MYLSNLDNLLLVELVLGSLQYIKQATEKLLKV